MGKRPHLLIMPYHGQGHVVPLMKLAHLISDHKIKVTILVSEFIHSKLVASLSHESEVQSRIELVSIPDGLDTGDDRRDIPRVLESILRVMPGHLKDFIHKVNRSIEDEQITCIIADIAFGWWPMEVANKMGIEGVLFCAFGSGTLALGRHTSKLVEARIVNSTDGSALTQKLVCISEGIPVLSSNRLPWCRLGDLKAQEAIFRSYLSFANEAKALPNRLLCNCVYELDLEGCDLIPNIIPIGPLVASNRHSVGNFWPEDSTCINWLHNQSAGSIIYVAFGSSTIFNQDQFNELAFGLELVGRPFLWVVRSNFTKESAAEYPDGFIERVAGRGKIVSWAPQEKVLSHPSIACFLSHCGWNSVMEAVVNGVPFLCWPYSGDQFHNQSYICNKWKVGLGLDPDENGIISKQEIKMKIEKLVSDGSIRGNANKLKEIARKSGSEGGSSYNNLKAFVEAMKH